MSKCGTVDHCRLTGFESAATFLCGITVLTSCLCAPSYYSGFLTEICMLGNSKLIIDMNVSVNDWISLVLALRQTVIGSSPTATQNWISR